MSTLENDLKRSITTLGEEKKMAKEKSTASHKVLTGIGIALCVILIPILILNCTLLVKGWTNKDQVPSIGGVAPMIVLTDSMVGEAEDCFNGGDLIFVKTVKPEDIKVGDVISYFDPNGNGSTVTSHRVTNVFEKDGTIYFNTKGDNNNIEDKLPVAADKLVGKYTGFRIAGAGQVAMFMQTTWGLIICVVVPLVILVGYDAIRRAKYNKKHDDEKDKLLAELEELRKLKGETGADGTQEKSDTDAAPAKDAE